MLFKDTFTNISVISWRSVLLVKETGGPGENHWPVVNHWQTLSHNVVHLALTEIRTHNISTAIGTDCIGSCKSNYHMITATAAFHHYAIIFLTITVSTIGPYTRQSFPLPTRLTHAPKCPWFVYTICLFMTIVEISITFIYIWKYPISSFLFFFFLNTYSLLYKLLIYNNLSSPGYLT